MAVKNLFSFNPGETIVAEELLKRLKKKIDLYFQLKIRGLTFLPLQSKKIKQ